MPLAELQDSQKMNPTIIKKMIINVMPYLVKNGVSPLINFSTSLQCMQLRFINIILVLRDLV